MLTLTKEQIATLRRHLDVGRISDDGLHILSICDSHEILRAEVERLMKVLWSIRCTLDEASASATLRYEKIQAAREICDANSSISY